MEIFFAALAEAIIDLVVGDLAEQPRLAGLREWLRGESPEKRAFQLALLRAYKAFGEKHPGLAASFFDERLLEKPEVKKELAKLLTINQKPDETKLQNLWHDQFRTKQPNVDIKEPLAFFLNQLKKEIQDQLALKPFVDGQAFHQLYAIAEGVREQVEVSKQMAALLQEIRDLLTQLGLQQPTYRIVVTSLLIDDPDDVPNLPPKLIGREDLLKETRDALDTHESVLLLQGFGGVGKTALAAWLAREYLQSGKSPVLWLEAGNAEAGALLEGLARPFGVDQARAVASLPLDGGQHHVRGLLKSAKIQLVVLDNAWDGNALQAALAAIPKGIPALVTSRQKMPTGALIEVGVLSRAAALELLRLHAKSDGSGADDLCELLGDHAYAVEIAGKTLNVDGLTPAELTRRIKDAPHTLRMPEDFAAAGRESVARLIDVSLEALREKDETAYQTFLAFGAFFAPTLTAELLGMYFAETPESKAGVGEGLRPSPTTGETGEVTTALTLLVRRGLAEHIPATEDTVEHYRVHDLAHSYARTQQEAANHESALAACLSYTQKYEQPSLANFAALRPTLDTLMGAAGWALENGQYAEVSEFAHFLYLGTGAGGFLTRQGYPDQAITLFNWTIEAAHMGGNKQVESAALGNLGNIYVYLGQVERAVTYHEQSLAISRETGDKRGEGVALGSLGIAYRNLGRVEQAIKYHKRALAISRTIDDMSNVISQLGSLGNAYMQIKQIKRAIGYYKQVLDYHRETGDKHGEGNDLGNLGNAYFLLGQMEQAIKYHSQGLAISRIIGDRQEEGTHLGNLGSVYSCVGQTKRAIEYHKQALAIHHRVSDARGESRDLANLGLAYEIQGDYHRALNFYQQARGIFIAIGAAHLVAQVDGNIARLRGKMGGDAGQ